MYVYIYIYIYIYIYESVCVIFMYTRMHLLWVHVRHKLCKKIYFIGMSESHK